MLEILIDNKDGHVWDISSIAEKPKWNTYRIGKPSSFEFTLIHGGLKQDDNFKINNGDVVRVMKDNQKVFYGYVFKVQLQKGKQAKIKCYDQRRYLMNKDTYVFKQIKANEIVERIASDFNLRVGSLADTGYVIPTMVEDSKKLMDIIWKGLDLTLINTHQNFIFDDDFGKLVIRNIEDMMLDFYIGDNSLLTDYDFARDIDSDTYNKIKLVQNNKESGRRDVYVAQDSSNISKWGTLQYYQAVDENLNSAQIKEMLDQLAAIKNREKQTMKIKAIGDVRVRAGCYVPIIIDELNINQPFIVNEAKHDLSDDHTVDVELKVV